MTTDELIERAKPDLKIALEAVLHGKAVHFFEIGQLPLTNGQKWNITCVILTEPQTKLVEAVLNGVAEMNKSYTKALVGTKIKPAQLADFTDTPI